MKPELDVLQSLIGKEFPTLDLAQQIGSAIDEWKSQVSREAERLKVIFKQQYFAIKEEKHFEKYIQSHQFGLTSLIDDFYNQQEFESKTAPELHQFFYKTVEELLSFIEKNFSKYFDQDAQVPSSYRAIVRQDMDESSHSIESLFQKKRLDAGLKDLATAPLKRFAGINSEKTTFRQVIYLKELKRQLNKILSAKGNATREVRILLFYLNFNSVKYLLYCTKQIMEFVKRSRSLNGQLDRLAFIHKVVNQTQVKPGYALNPDLRSLREQLSDWLSEELMYLEKKHQLTIDFPARPEEFSKVDFKLDVNLSVAQFAFLIKSLVEVNLIQNKNVLDLLRFFARSVKTKNTLNIQLQSFRSKYYKPENAAKLAIQTKLTEVINHIKKTF